MRTKKEKPLSKRITETALQKSVKAVQFMGVGVYGGKNFWTYKFLV